MKTPVSKLNYTEMQVNNVHIYIYIYVVLYIFILTYYIGITRNYKDYIVRHLL